MAERSTVARAERDLVLTRTFDAPRGRVFDAWTTTGELVRWWGPRGYTTVSCALDPRPGGAWRVRSRSPEGIEYAEHGVVREIARPGRLVFTHAWEHPDEEPSRETLVTVELGERAGVTEMRFHQGVFGSLSSRDGHAEGWSSAFELLAEHLAASADVQAIRRLIGDGIRALHDKDAARLASFVVPDVLSYDLAPPLLHRGAGVYRRGLEEWFRTFTGPVGYEVRDLHVETRGDLAVATSLDHITGTRANGEHTDVWVRATIVYRKVEGRWVIAHEHRSVPFYMDGSLKAAVDLEP